MISGEQRHDEGKKGVCMYVCVHMCVCVCEGEREREREREREADSSVGAADGVKGQL